MPKSSKQTSELRHVFGHEIADLIAGTSVCSFCGRDENEYDILIRGPRVQICDFCVELCREEIEFQKSERTQQIHPSDRDA